MRAHLRTLRANYDRASRDLFSTSRMRRGCPMQLQLKHKRFTGVYELLQLGEHCLKELNHCHALRIAGFRPGDHILVTTILKGFDPSPRRYIVTDVVWHKGDSSMEYCNLPLDREATVLANSCRASAKRLLEDVLEKGDLARFQPRSTVTRVPETRQYPFWLRQG